MNFKIIWIVLITSFFTKSCNKDEVGLSSPVATKVNPVNGISFEAINEVIDPEDVVHVEDVNANWSALIPFGFMQNLEATSIFYNTEPGQVWWGETEEGIREISKLFHQKNIQVLLKPQIWIPGSFTGDISYNSEEKWQIFETNYENFILTYAIIAERYNLEMFAIGTEMKKFSVERPMFWKQLIPKIKEVYSGKLTYAANWDEYEHVSFYEDLDFIGVNAYFPLSDAHTPELEALKTAWQAIKTKLQTKSETIQKKILFTEFGYRNIDFNTKEPWDASHADQPINHQAQINALKAVFETFWEEEWFAGGFIWKWHQNDENVNGETDNRFTVQNKPAEEILKEQYEN
ncbi:glycoside hydrolase family 113 [Aureivirga marina]|uniref:glycoside hydrolase family 113 n=1 Tax=Aureivirga marina TaxID=1182451 RepID=UPI0018CA2B1F|nr:glycoside hydrolase [Aureivirga marina]